MSACTNLTFQSEIALDAAETVHSKQTYISVVFHILHDFQLHSRLFKEPLKLTATNNTTVSPDTKHHCQLKLLPLIEHGWKRIESGARIG